MWQLGQQARAILALATRENMLGCVYMCLLTRVLAGEGRGSASGRVSPALAVLTCALPPPPAGLEAGVGVSGEASPARSSGRGKTGRPYHRRCGVGATGPAWERRGQLDAGPRRSLLFLFL